MTDLGGRIIILQCIWIRNNLAKRETLHCIDVSLFVCMFFIHLHFPKRYIKLKKLYTIVTASTHYTASIKVYQIIIRISSNYNDNLIGHSYEFTV